MRRSVLAGLAAIIALSVGFLIGQKPVYADAAYLANGLLPAVPIPIDNPQTDAKIRLGQQLFFDGRLSSDGTISCASCHNPNHAWADVTPKSAGVGHKLGGRNSPSVINAAYIIPQFWDGRALHLEKQAVGPVQNPLEMDLTKEQLEGRLNLIPGYVSQFETIFGERPTIDLMAKAIASFERTIIDNDSPYDRYLRGDRCAMSGSAIRGMKIFNGIGHCTTCHSGPAFSDSRFHNIGVGYSCGKFADVGRYDVTKCVTDTGAFLTPKLRNVAQTPPYLHDGSEATLEAAVDFYDKGGIANPYLDPAILPLNLTRQEKCDLVEFLKALSGPYPIVGAPPLPNPELTAQVLEQMLKGGAR